MKTLLIIEDERLFGSELSLHYRSQGWEVSWASTLAEAKQLLLKKNIDPLLILSDMNLPDGNALDFMEEIKKKVVYAEWLFLTAYGSVPDSVRALRLGAYDFLEKPCDLDRLDLVISSATRSATIQRRLIEQTNQEHKRYSPEAYL
ncbi:partial Regulatory protein LuxO, partial [Methylococcales bacterium]